MNYYNYTYGNIPNQYSQSTTQTNLSSNNTMSTNNVFQNQTAQFYPYLFSAQPMRTALNNTNLFYQQMIQMASNNNSTQQTYAQHPIIIVPSFQNHQTMNNLNRGNAPRRTSYPSTVRASSMQQQHLQQQISQRMVLNNQNMVHTDAQPQRFSVLQSTYSYQQPAIDNTVNRAAYTQNTRLVTPVISMPIDRGVRRPLADPTYPQPKRSPPCGNVNKLSILYMKKHIDANSTACKELDEEYANRPYYKVYY